MQFSPPIIRRWAQDKWCCPLQYVPDRRSRFLKFGSFDVNSTRSDKSGSARQMLYYCMSSENDRSIRCFIFKNIYNRFSKKIVSIKKKQCGFLSLHISFQCFNKTEQFCNSRYFFNHMRTFYFQH